MNSTTICIVGVGYVGLPLAHALARAGHTVSGYDVNSDRIAELNEGRDSTNEIGDEGLREVSIYFTDNPDAIGDAKVVIVAVPTPIDTEKKPDLEILKNASEAVGQHLAVGMTVVFESTVYPGTTEEICGPILEEASGLKSGSDFHLGYSPERINPGDKTRTIDKIIKVVAGDDEETTDMLCELYGTIIEAGVHRAPSIKVAEMSKAIENAQRDLNIAYINEIAMVCDRLGVSTQDVLDAAGTKWNFLRFDPGLVGGHCIGVDPYYLVEKAEQLGLKTNIITAGRGVNEGMAGEVVRQVSEGLGKEASVLVLGLTFKENVPDTRNSKAYKVIAELRDKGFNVEAHDAQLSDEQIAELGVDLAKMENGPYDAVVLLVPHDEYCDLEKLLSLTKEGGLIYDLKSVLDKTAIESTGRRYSAL